ncbi:MAG: helix-turn-helix domain-containing protein [Firmicutes bacterium]|nr:helix-turn-helix domain-containing protein [Bacillota bacterium]
MSKLKNKETDRLFEALMRLETVDEFYEFFEDLCTVKEIKDMSQRLQVATLLRQGKSYQKVSEITSVSSATISRVKRCLDYGTGGYGKVLDRMEEK